MITCDSVSVTIEDPLAGPRSLLDAVSVTLTEPLISVIGPNGSGKSTFLQLFNGLVNATYGTVTVDGVNVAQHPKKVRTHVGFVFSDPAAQLVMPTVIEDVELSLRTVPKKDRRARALEILDSLGIAGLATRSVYELSGGQRQLVAIASVLATSPATLILDEPTTLLDLANRELIRDAIATLVARGITVIYSTHDLEFAQDAQRCLLIDAGGIAADGTPAEVVAAYRAQVAATAVEDTRTFGID